MREKLIEILRQPIYLHLDADPIEALADYLLDSGVAVPVRCKDCKRYVPSVGKVGMCNRTMQGLIGEDCFCSYGERRTDG